GI
ncbi:hypothetical protein D031_3625B, partial [Vibrio parahaemolyticus VP-48]